MALSDLFNMNSPQGMGMYGMAQGLLSAAGRSPVPISMGSALGMGAGGALQGILAAHRRQLFGQHQAMQQYQNVGAPNPLMQQPMPGMTVPTPSGLMAHPVLQPALNHLFYSPFMMR